MYHHFWISNVAPHPHLHFFKTTINFWSSNFILQKQQTFLSLIRYGVWNLPQIFFCCCQFPAVPSPASVASKTQCRALHTVPSWLCCCHWMNCEQGLINALCTRTRKLCFFFFFPFSITYYFLLPISNSCCSNKRQSSKSGTLCVWVCACLHACVKVFRLEQFQTLPVTFIHL